MIQREHKDRLFSSLFGREEHKEWSLCLYNALNHSHYTNKDDIEINTIENVLYLGMKNDVSFIMMDELNLYAHQSTYNPNMPVRELVYAGMLYSKYIEQRDLNIYSSRIIRIPVPRIVVFFNGTDDVEDEVILELKDAFPESADASKADISVRARMLNINYGKNAELLEACRPLWEYSKLNADIRNNMKTMEKEAAVGKAIDDMAPDSVIKPYIIGNKAEVTRMILTDYNEEETMRRFKEEYLEEGRQSIIDQLIADGKLTPSEAEQYKATNPIGN